MLALLDEPVELDDALLVLEALLDELLVLEALFDELLVLVALERSDVLVRVDDLPESSIVVVVVTRRLDVEVGVCVVVVVTVFERVGETVSFVVVVV